MNMRRFVLAVLSLSLCLNASAQKIKWHNAADLTIIGKAIPTSEPSAILTYMLEVISPKLKKILKKYNIR